MNPRGRPMWPRGAPPPIANPVVSRTQRPSAALALTPSAREIFSTSTRLTPDVMARNNLLAGAQHDRFRNLCDGAADCCRRVLRRPRSVRKNLDRVGMVGFL